MAHPSVCLFSMNLSTLILTCFDLKKMLRYAEIRFFMPKIWRTFNHFIAKIVNFYMVSLAQWETIHHIPSKCQPSGGWFGGRETPELGREGCAMVSTDSDFAWPLFHIKNANIRNHTSYIGTLFRFETPVVGMHFGGQKCEMLDSLVRNSSRIHLWRCAKLVEFCSNVPS